MFIIDFDDTLFDTNSYQIERMKVLGELGINVDLYKKTYQEAYKNNEGMVTYSDYNHAQVLGHYGFNRELIYDKLKHITDNLPRFIFEDTISLLEDLKKYNQPLVLLSLGNPIYQELKIKHCLIDKYFDKIFMVDQHKFDVLDELLNNSSDLEYWFINDKPPETKELFSRFSQLKVIMKVSAVFSKEQYQILDFPYFKTLTEIKNYVANQLR